MEPEARLLAQGTGFFHVLDWKRTDVDCYTFHQKTADMQLCERHRFSRVERANWGEILSMQGDFI